MERARAGWWWRFKRNWGCRSNSSGWANKRMTCSRLTRSNTRKLCFPRRNKTCEDHGDLDCCVAVGELCDWVRETRFRYFDERFDGENEWLRGYECAEE